MVETLTVVLPQEYLVPGMVSKIKLDLNTITISAWNFGHGRWRESRKR